MAQNFNRAAGFRRLGARKAARQIDYQTEAVTRIAAADRLLVDLLDVVRKMHLHLDAGEKSLVEANRIACSAEYVPPTQQEAVAS